MDNFESENVLGKIISNVDLSIGVICSLKSNPFISSMIISERMFPVMFFGSLIEEQTSKFTNSKESSFVESINSLFDIVPLPNILNEFLLL